jgi:hypothetical protein
MSLLHDALKRAQSLQEERKVIRVPKDPAIRRANAAALLVAVACLAVTIFGLRKEHKTSQLTYTDLESRLSTIDAKHEDLVKRIHTDEPYLDTRIQLEVFEVETALRALSARVDAMEMDKNSGLAGNIAMKEELKAEMALVSKRLHNVERDHSVLADRIEAVKTGSSEQTS